MKHDKLDSKNFKKKKWKNTDLKNEDSKLSLTIKDMEKK